MKKAQDNEITETEGDDAADRKDALLANLGSRNGLTLSNIEAHRLDKIAHKRNKAIHKALDAWAKDNKQMDDETESDYVLRQRAGTVKERVDIVYEEVSADMHGQNMDWFKWISTIMGILAGLMWTYVLVGFLIDLLNCFGTLLNLDNTYLGLTILAVGNALPDALTTISLCKNGSATMALAGGYAGQLFGLLVGFGLAQLKTTLAQGSQTFDLFNPAAINENLLDLLVLGTAFICLVFTFVWAMIFKFKMGKAFAGIVMVIYMVFLITCSVIAIMKAYHNF